MEKPTAHFNWKRKVQHVEVAKALESAGYALKDVLQIDMHGRPGGCVLTLRDSEIRDEIVGRGELEICGDTVQVLPGDGTVSSVRVFMYGCEPGLRDGHIA
eukprot:scpid109770/ scgid27923/ 